MLGQSETWDGGKFYKRGCLTRDIAKDLTDRQACVVGRWQDFTETRDTLNKFSAMCVHEMSDSDKILQRHVKH